MSNDYQHRLQKIKAKYPMAYQPWSTADDDLLRTSFMAGVSINALAKTLQRQPGAIRSRLKKLGTSAPNLDPITNQDAFKHASTENTLNDVETSTSHVITRSIAPLKEKDPVVYNLLISKIQRGFFEKPQPKTAIHSLANIIIEAISSIGG